MSDESKKAPSEGRFPEHAPDPVRDLLGALPGEGRGRGPGRRSAQFVEKIARDYGMLPGDLLAATLMRGLRRHLDDGGAPGDFMELRAIEIANSMQTSSASAMGMLLGVARELMPYVHQKQPLLVDVEKREIFFGMIASDGGPAAPGAGPLDMKPADVRASPLRSDAPGRTDAAKGLTVQEE